METNAATTTTEAVQQTNPLERRMDLSIAVADLDKEIDQRLKRLGKNAKMAGFRPGKIPANIIRQQYGDQARYEAMNELLDRAFKEKVKAEQIKVAGYPSIEPKNLEGTEVLEFTAIYEVYPEIKLAGLAEVEITRPVLEVGNAELEKTLDVLKKQRVRFEPVERAAQKGDRVVIDFLGKKDDVPFQGGEAKDYPVIVGEGMMLPDFENAIMGLKAGEAKSFDMTFPAEYHAKDLAGQPVTFEITVKAVNEPIMPEIDAEFAKGLGVADGNVEKMRSEIETNLKREVKKRLHGKIKNQIMDALLKANTVDVPTSLVDREIEELMNNAHKELEQRFGKKMPNMPIKREYFIDQAKRRIALGLILSEVVKTNELHAKPEQVRAYVDEMAQSYERAEDVVRWYYADPQRLADIEGLVIEDNVVTWALGQAKVIDQPADFDELMQQQQAQ